MQAISRKELEATPEIVSYLREIEHPDPQYPVCQDLRLFAGMIRRAFDREKLTVNREQLKQYLDKAKYFPYELLPWEKCLFALHNCVYREDGLLRWPEAFLYCGRGTGKNGYLSFEDFVLLTPVNGVKNYDIDIFANSEDQAKTSFMDVYNVLESNDRKLSRFFTWNLERIQNRQTGSVLRFRTSNAKTKDGGRPGKVDFDEFHAYENYDVVRVARTGLGKKPMARQTVITTDGDVRDGPLDHMLSRAKQILKGDLEDNGFLPMLYHLDAKEEVDDERNWHKANPSLRYFPNLMDQMRREYQEYKQDNLGNAAFMTKRMNVPIGAQESEITSWENIKACSVEADEEPTVWVAGIDFARTTDFVAVVLMGLCGDKWVWKTHSWVCSACKDLPHIKFPIREAEQKGLLTWVEDVEILPDLPVGWIADQMNEKNIIAVAIDDFRFSFMKRALESIGFIGGKEGNVQLVKGRDIMKIAPILISHLNRHELCFGDNPLMRWYINNAKQILDQRGNITFGKIEPKSRKTDGFMAGVAAATLVERLETERDIGENGFELFVYD